MSASKVKPYIRPVALPSEECVAEFCVYEGEHLVATPITAQSATSIARTLMAGVGWTFQPKPADPAIEGEGGL